MRKYIYLLPLIIIGFTSCEDVINVNLDEKDMGLFVVEAKITTIDEPYVFLTKSTLVTSDEIQPGISGAVINITDNASPANIITLIEDPDRRGYYTVPSGIDYYGVVGREYSLTIETEGVIISAKEYLARVEPIDSIQIHPSSFSFGDVKYLAIAVFSQETPGFGNLYKWQIYINDSALYKTEDMTFASDELVDGNYVDDLEIFVDYFDPSKEEEERRLKLHDTVYVKQNSISQVTYDFYSQMVNQNFGGSFFSVPPANAHSNLTASDDKKVLGLFTAQDVSISNKVIIDDKIESMLEK